MPKCFKPTGKNDVDIILECDVGINLIFILDWYNFIITSVVTLGKKSYIYSSVKV